MRVKAVFQKSAYVLDRLSVLIGKDHVPSVTVTLHKDGSGYFDIPTNISQETITKIRSELSYMVGSERWRRIEVCFIDKVVTNSPSWRTVLRLTFCHMRIDS